MAARKKKSTATKRTAPRPSPAHAHEETRAQRAMKEIVDVLRRENCRLVTRTGKITPTPTPEGGVVLHVAEPTWGVMAVPASPPSPPEDARHGGA